MTICLLDKVIPPLETTPFSYLCPDPPCPILSRTSSRSQHTVGSSMKESARVCGLGMSLRGQTCWYKAKPEKPSNQTPMIRAHHRQHHVCTREEEAHGVLVFSACPFQAATQETEIIGRFWAFGMKLRGTECSVFLIIRPQVPGE